MDLARKFLLIPSEREHQFSEEHLSDLDKKIQNILKKKVNDDEKAKEYIQALQKYVTFPNMNAVKPIKENVDNAEQPLQTKIDIESNVLDSVPVKHQNTARKIVNFLNQRGISWTKDKELLLDGKVIVGSNMIKLVTFLLRNQTRRPVGFEKFQELLADNDFPHHLVKNVFLTQKKTMHAKPISVKRKLPSRNWQKMY